MNTLRINIIKLRLEEIEKEKEQLLLELKRLSSSVQNRNDKSDYTPQEK